MENTIVVSVNNVPQRDLTIANIYNSYVVQYPEHYTAEQIGFSCIKIYHREDGIDRNLRSHVCTYRIIVVPINIDLRPLRGFTGSLYFELSKTITSLKEKLAELESLQGEQVIKENFNAPSLEELAGLLPRIK